MLALMLVAKVFGKAVKKGEYEPTVSVLLSAWNEESVIEEKRSQEAGHDIVKYYAMKRLSYDGKSYNVGDIIYTNQPADGMVKAT